MPRCARPYQNARAIERLLTGLFTPRIKRKVERQQWTLEREWAYVLEYASSDARRPSPPHPVNRYNERRIRSALG
jgi:hypothetical protein